MILLSVSSTQFQNFLKYCKTGKGNHRLCRWSHNIMPGELHAPRLVHSSNLSMGIHKMRSRECPSAVLDWSTVCGSVAVVSCCQHRTQQCCCRAWRCWSPSSLLLRCVDHLFSDQILCFLTPISGHLVSHRKIIDLFQITFSPFSFQITSCHFGTIWRLCWYTLLLLTLINKASSFFRICTIDWSSLSLVVYTSGQLQVTRTRQSIRTCCRSIRPTLSSLCRRCCSCQDVQTGRILHFKHLLLYFTSSAMIRSRQMWQGPAVRPHIGADRWGHPPLHDQLLPRPWLQSQQGPGGHCHQVVTYSAAVFRWQ